MNGKTGLDTWSCLFYLVHGPVTALTPVHHGNPPVLQYFCVLELSSSLAAEVVSSVERARLLRGSHPALLPPVRGPQLQLQVGHLFHETFLAFKASHTHPPGSPRATKTLGVPGPLDTIACQATEIHICLQTMVTSIHLPPSFSNNTFNCDFPCANHSPVGSI